MLACRRHSIPVSPRGYWARLHAGQTPEQVALPDAKGNPEVVLSTSPEKKAYQDAATRQLNAFLSADVELKIPSLDIQFFENLNKARPLVKRQRNTAAAFPA